MFKVRFKELRKQKNLTMMELGDKLGVGKSTIAGYESGDRNPKMSMLIKITETFNTSADYLLGLTDNPNPAKDTENLASIIEKNSFNYNGNKMSDEDLELFIQLLERFLNTKNNDLTKEMSEG